MAEANTVPGDQLTATITRLAALAWPIARDELATAVIEPLGWSLTTAPGGTFIEADDHLPINRTIVEFGFARGQLSTITFDACDVVVDESPWRTGFLQDAFVAALNATSAALGPASTQKKGKTPKAVWELPNEARLELTKLEMAVTITLNGAEYARALRILER
jgi:hypothetical protein